MNRKPIAFLAAVCLMALTCFRAARADDPQYAFQPGEKVTYQIKISVQSGQNIHTQTSYTVYHVASVKPDGQMQLTYNWGIDNGGSSLAWMFAEPSGPKLITIDPHGKFIDTAGLREDAQLEASQGNAWRFPIQPLPTGGQNSWNTHEIMHLINEPTGPFGGLAFPAPPGFGGPPFGGPFGGPQGPAQTKADENITYTADAPQGNQLTIHRQYDLQTQADAGDNAEHLHGDGQYLFDTQSGRVTSIQWHLTVDIKSGSLPITVEAHLLTPDDWIKLKADYDAGVIAEKKAREQQAADRAAELARIHAEGKLRDEEMGTDFNNPPDGTEKTDIVGDAKDSGLFLKASNERKPVIGFLIKSGEWFGRRNFPVLEPLYSRPTAPPERDVHVVIAKDGYAVGSVTANGGHYVNAICIRFMKINSAGSGLDPNTSYLSLWYGQKLGAYQKKLGGDGGFVYGICGRRGLGVDALGLVVDSSPPPVASPDANPPAANNFPPPDRDVPASGKENPDADNANPVGRIGRRAPADPVALGELPREELITDINSIPDGMQKTQIMGTTQGGGPFVAASIDRKPIIGFRIKLGNWDNRVCFSELEPLYTKPTAPREQGVLNLLAKDGYAVGSVTVNAGEFLNALCVRFMKINGSALDPKTFYVSPWYGRKIGTSQTKLDANGNFVCGIYGRKGLNVDALGLIIDTQSATPTDDSNKP